MQFEIVKHVFSVSFMIAILATMAIVTGTGMLPEAEAFKKANGTFNPKYGSDTKGIVCGDQLCYKIKNVSNTSDIRSASHSESSPVYASWVSIQSMNGAQLVDTQVDRNSDTVTVLIDAQEEGKVILNLSPNIEDAFMVIVDGEEWDDAHIDGNDVNVFFHAGTEKIEIIANISG